MRLSTPQASKATVTFSPAATRTVPGSPIPPQEDETRHQGPHGGPVTVREIQKGKDPPGVDREEPQKAGTHERERGSEEDGGREDQQGHQPPLRRGEQGRFTQQREKGGVGEPLEGQKHVVEEETVEAHAALGPGIPEEGPSDVLGPLTSQQSTDGEPTEEDRQHDDLGVGRVAHEQAEVPAPDGLVDEARAAGEEECQIQ